jgi:hypothetical protein
MQLTRNAPPRRHASASRIWGKGAAAALVLCLTGGESRQTLSTPRGRVRSSAMPQTGRSEPRTYRERVSAVLLADLAGSGRAILAGGICTSSGELRADVK